MSKETETLKIEVEAVLFSPGGTWRLTVFPNAPDSLGRAVEIDDFEDVTADGHKVDFEALMAWLVNRAFVELTLVRYKAPAYVYTVSAAFVTNPEFPAGTDPAIVRYKFGLRRYTEPPPSVNAGQ